MKYVNGSDVELGDSIRHAGVVGTVIGAPTQDGVFAAKEGFEWISDAGQGVWVRFENGAIVHLHEPDEDLELVRRRELT